MGKIKQGILGGFSGKVGNVIGTSWKGISVVKVMPQSVANPRTTAQVSQRSALSASVSLAVAILSTLIKPLWDRFSQGMSGYNAFISANIANMSADGFIDPSSAVMSKGKLEPIGSITATINAQGQAVIAYTPGELGSYGSVTDKLFITIYNATKNIAEANGTLGTRGNGGSVTWGNYPANVEAGDELHIYGSLRREDGTIVSNSVYGVVINNL